MRPNHVAALRREAGVGVAECAALYRVGVSTYLRWERGDVPSGRDWIATMAPVAALLAARLGRPISPQWECCGLVAPTRHQPSRAALPSSNREQAGPCAPAARLALVR